MSADWIESREDCPRCGAALLIESEVGEAIRYCSFVECTHTPSPERTSPNERTNSPMP